MMVTKYVYLYLLTTFPAGKNAVVNPRIFLITIIRQPMCIVTFVHIGLGSLCLPTIFIGTQHILSFSPILHSV